MREAATRFVACTACIWYDYGRQVVQKRISATLRLPCVIAAYKMYASFLMAARALHLNTFEQPVKRVPRFFCMVNCFSNSLCGEMTEIIQALKTAVEEA